MRKILFGYHARVDVFGRLFFDKCATDQEHLQAQAPEGQERPGCRIYATDLFGDLVGGRKANWDIQVDVCLRTEPSSAPQET